MIQAFGFWVRRDGVGLKNTRTSRKINVQTLILGYFYFVVVER